jgi:quercetin dioxygenase-like cupin family protein
LTATDTTSPEAGSERSAELARLLDSRIASRESRVEDWDTLEFQTKAGPEFARAQIRYIGSGATGDHEDDTRIIPSAGFTLSNMRLPAGGVGPSHVHDDAEEVFFMLEGTLEVTLIDGDASATRTLGYRDAISVPPGIARELRNPGTDDALFCVIIGSKKPELPWYPEGSAMHGVTRD